MSIAARAISSRAVSSISLAGIRKLPFAFTLVAAELVLDGIDERLPGSFDDVVGHPDGAPRLVPVAGRDEHAGLGCRPLRLVEDAHLVVQQAHLAEVRVELLEGLAERVVERVDRPVAGGGRVLGHALDLEPDRRFGHGLAAVALLLDDDPEAVEVEVGLVVAERALHQQLERRLGALELEALVLHALEHLEDAARLGRVLVEVDAVLLGLPEDVRLPRQLGDEHSPVVAYGFRIDVLVGIRVLEDGGDVDTALVGKGRIADVRLRTPRLAVGQLRHEARDVAQLAEVLPGDAVEAHLDHDVGDDRDEVRVAAALAVAVDRPLDVVDALGDRRERVRHGALGVVVDVDAQRRLGLHVLLDLADDLHDLVRQAAAVGVAEDQAAGARGLGGSEGLERVLAVLLEAVEEVLGVVDNLLEVLEEVGDRVPDHVDVLVERRPEGVRHVEVPRLAEDGDDRGARLDERLDVAVLLRPHSRTARRAEGGDLGGLEDSVLNALEEAEVLGVRARPAALDIVDAEGVQALGYADLVLHGEGHALALRPVAQRGVVNLDFPGHGTLIIPPPRPGCQVCALPPQTTPAARSFSTLDPGIRRRPVGISSVCWPRRGGGAWAAPGVFHRRIGTPIAVTAPALGCARCTNMPRARR